MKRETLDWLFARQASGDGFWRNKDLSCHLDGFLFLELSVSFALDPGALFSDNEKAVRRCLASMAALNGQDPSSERDSFRQEHHPHTQHTEADVVEHVRWLAPQRMARQRRTKAKISGAFLDYAKRRAIRTVVSRDCKTEGEGTCHQKISTHLTVPRGWFPSLQAPMTEFANLTDAIRRLLLQPDVTENRCACGDSSCDGMVSKDVELISLPTVLVVATGQEDMVMPYEEEMLLGVAKYELHGVVFRKPPPHPHYTAAARLPVLGTDGVRCKWKWFGYDDTQKGSITAAAASLDEASKSIAPLAGGFLPRAWYYLRVDDEAAEHVDFSGDILVHTSLMKPMFDSVDHGDEPEGPYGGVY